MSNKILICHKGLNTPKGETIFTEGKEYKVVREGKDLIAIHGDGGEEQLFTKEKDEKGLSYKDYFKIK